MIIVEALIARVNAVIADRDALRVELAAEKHYGEFGRQWQADSSLERWFPITANGYRKLQAERDELKAQLAAERGNGDALAEALAGIYSMMQDGALVRSTSQDHLPGWALGQLPLVLLLQRTQAALAAHDARRKESSI